MTAISSILKTYGGSIKDIDLGNVQASQNAFDNIKSFVTNIPSLVIMRLILKRLKNKPIQYRKYYPRIV